MVFSPSSRCIHHHNELKRTVSLCIYDIFLTALFNLLGGRSLTERIFAKSGPSFPLFFSIASRSGTVGSPGIFWIPNLKIILTFNFFGVL